MKRAMLGFCVLSLTSGCAVVSNLRNGNVSGAVHAAGEEGVAKAGDAKRAHDRASKETAEICEPLKTKPVGFAEERALGGSVIIGTLTAGYFIDKDDEHDPKKLQAKVDSGAKVVLAESEKNDLTTYVERVGANLAGFSTRPGIPWAFGVVDSPDLNAMSAPGGYVVVTTGVVKAAGNEAQLAGVLAHEIAHVAQRHSLKIYQEQRATVCNLMVNARAYSELGISELPAGAGEWLSVYKDGLLVIGPDGVDLDKGAGKFVSKIVDFMNDRVLKRAQEDEFEADEVAMELLTDAGYDSNEYIAMLKKLPANGAMFSNHPSVADRVAKLEQWRKDNPFDAGHAKPPLEFTKALK